MNRWLHIACVTLGTTACRGAPSEEPPIVPIRNMYNQPRYDAQQASPLFADGRGMRDQVQGTVAREMEIDPIASTGWSEGEQTWVLTTPESVVHAYGDMDGMVERGRGRYEVYCSPCHGLSGEGDGMVPRVAKGGLVPPTFHSDRLRTMPDGQVFATISYGVRTMPGHKHNIPINDRWAIVSYLRALQLSQARP